MFQALALEAIRSYAERELAEYEAAEAIVLERTERSLSRIERALVCRTLQRIAFVQGQLMDGQVFDTPAFFEREMRIGLDEMRRQPFFQKFINLHKRVGDAVQAKRMLLAQLRREEIACWVSPIKDERNSSSTCAGGAYRRLRDQRGRFSCTEMLQKTEEENGL